MNSLLTKLFGKRSKYTYKDRFNSRKDAAAHSKNSQDYGSKSYDARAVKRLQFDECYTQGRSMIVPLILSVLDKDQFAILDIGGGVNSVFSHLDQIKKQKQQCFVLERPEVTLDLNSKIPKKYSNHLKYIDSIADIKELDIAYFGSSVQYIEDYKALIQKIATISPEFIIFSESIFTNENEDYFVLQVNMFPDVFPNRFISEKKLVVLMRNLNYQCTYSRAVSGDFSHETIDRTTYDCKTLVFKKQNKKKKGNEQH